MAHDTADLLLPHADPEVRLIELVWDIPAEGPKLSPLLHYCVEETALDPLEAHWSSSPLERERCVCMCVCMCVC